jgi:hypothetical protein
VGSSPIGAAAIIANKIPASKKCHRQMLLRRLAIFPDLG